MKTTDKKSKDPFDVLIFEKGLRIKYLDIHKELDLFLVILNNGKVLKLHLSDYARLKKASKVQLNNWKLINNGIGVTWDKINEDLSIKGFIKDAALNTMLHNLLGHEENAVA